MIRSVLRPALDVSFSLIPRTENTGNRHYTVTSNYPSIRRSSYTALLIPRRLIAWKCNLTRRLGIPLARAFNSLGIFTVSFTFLRVREFLFELEPFVRVVLDHSIFFNVERSFENSRACQIASSTDQKLLYLVTNLNIREYHIGQILTIRYFSILRWSVKYNNFSPLIGTFRA